MKPVSTIVRSFHCDSYQHMNNARYLELLEDARWKFLEPKIDDEYFEKSHLMLLVVNININYKFPAVSNDVLETDVHLDRFTNASIILRQSVYNRTKGKLSADAEVTFVLYDKSRGKVVTINDEIKKIFTELNEQD